MERLKTPRHLPQATSGCVSGTGTEGRRGPPDAGARLPRTVGGSPGPGSRPAGCPEHPGALPGTRQRGRVTAH